MNNNVKLATTAGLLGIFLGGVGAHDWYLGRKSKGIVHVALFAGGIFLEILVPVLMAVLTYRTLVSLAFLMTMLAPLGALMMGVSGIWGFIEGIVILTQGDAGLAQKGYAVAAPQPMYGQPYNNGQYNGGQMNYGQNMMQGQNVQNGQSVNQDFSGMQGGNNGVNMHNNANGGWDGGANGR